MDEMARSALVEVGNIIICSYINAFSQLVNVDVGTVRSKCYHQHAVIQWYLLLSMDMKQIKLMYW